jgi:hypothetical protein
LSKMPQGNYIEYIKTYYGYDRDGIE